MAHTEFCALKMLCREREKFHNLQFALCTKFCVCVPQCEGNEFLSFFSWLTKWREFPKCYMAHLVKVLACLARKSQSYFDSCVTVSKSSEGQKWSLPQAIMNCGIFIQVQQNCVSVWGHGLPQSLTTRLVVFWLCGSGTSGHDLHADTFETVLKMYGRNVDSLWFNP